MADGLMRGGCAVGRQAGRQYARAESRKSEWPKDLDVDVPGRALPASIEVIPADVGQELHRAVCRAFEKYPNEDAWQIVYPAMSRYEREVGK